MNESNQELAILKCDYVNYTYSTKLTSSQTYHAQIRNEVLSL